MASSDRQARTVQYEDAAFIDAVETIDSVAGTNDVAEIVGCSYETAYKRLCALEDDGRLESDKLGKTLMWTLADG